MEARFHVVLRVAGVADALGVRRLAERVHAVWIVEEIRVLGVDFHVLPSALGPAARDKVH